MFNPVHIILAAVTVRAAVDLTAGTLVRYTGNYDTTKPLLGFVLADVKAGELTSVAIKGVFQIKVASGATFAVGDPISVNASGVGIVGSTAQVGTVLEFTPGLATIIL